MGIFYTKKFKSRREVTEQNQGETHKFKVHKITGGCLTVGESNKQDEPLDSSSSNLITHTR